MNPFDKVTDYDKVRSLFFDGMTLLFGGFGGVGTPPGLVDCPIDSGVKDVNLIGNNRASNIIPKLWIQIKLTGRGAFQTMLKVSCEACWSVWKSKCRNE